MTSLEVGDRHAFHPLTRLIQEISLLLLLLLLLRPIQSAVASCAPFLEAGSLAV
jgi:hypothetical protein